MPEIILPVTRYYGSKRKLIEPIWQKLEERGLNFESVIDLFGGSGMFSYYAKAKGKRVIYNDLFKFNHLVGKALIENDTPNLSEEEALALLQKKPGRRYDNIIERNFHDIYYPDDENQLIDVIVQNIIDIQDPQTQASAYYIFFQACLIKRPYNLFHRKNLNLRVNYAGGTFGNKVTWERPFQELFIKFTDELQKVTFTNHLANISVNFNALNCPDRAELAYIDPPYFQNRNHVPYHSKYHFLEGLANYDNIEEHINYAKNHKEISINKTKDFESKANFLNDLDLLLNIHRDAIIVVSYRNNGIPSIDEIADLLRSFKANVDVINLGNYGYALNRNNVENYEFLILGY
jgi:adenine-specific DNA-methyltransferase